MSKTTSLVPVFIFTVFLWSCSSDKPASENESKDLAESLEEMALLESGLQQLGRWTAYWKEISQDFRLNDFSMERQEFFEELEWPEDNPIGPENPFYPYLLLHPDSIGVVDIYSYKVFIPANGRPGFQPDSEVIFFKEDGMRERLHFIGPSGGFDDAIWVSPRDLMVVGFFEDEEGFTPKVWCIDIENHELIIFKHPFHTTNFDRHGYLKKRLTNISF